MPVSDLPVLPMDQTPTPNGSPAHLRPCPHSHSHPTSLPLPPTPRYLIPHPPPESHSPRMCPPSHCSSRLYPHFHPSALPEPSPHDLPRPPSTISSCACYYPQASNAIHPPNRWRPHLPTLPIDILPPHHPPSWSQPPRSQPSPLRRYPLIPLLSHPPTQAHQPTDRSR